MSPVLIPLMMLIQGSAGAPDANDAIDQKSREFEVCFAKRDAACIVDRYFVPDSLGPTASPPGGSQPVVGRTALINMYEHLFKDVSSIQLETVSVDTSG